MVMMLVVVVVFIYLFYTQDAKVAYVDLCRGIGFGGSGASEQRKDLSRWLICFCLFCSALSAPGLTAHCVSCCLLHLLF